MLGLVNTPLPGYPLLPLLQVGIGRMQVVDLELSSDPAAWPERMLTQIAAVLDGCYVPLALVQGNVDFQLTRGEMGVSL